MNIIHYYLCCPCSLLIDHLLPQGRFKGRSDEAEIWRLLRNKSNTMNVKSEKLATPTENEVNMKDTFQRT
jgi:hypothetical protein